MTGRSAAIALVALLTLAVGCGGDGADGDGNGAKMPAADVQARAARFAKCAKDSEFVVVRPEPPNERNDFLHDEGFEFAEVNLEERPLLFFAAIVNFFPSQADATRARDRIGALSPGPSPVRMNNAVVHYTDEPGTRKHKLVKAVVVGCLRG